MLKYLGTPWQEVDQNEIDYIDTCHAILAEVYERRGKPDAGLVAAIESDLLHGVLLHNPDNGSVIVIGRVLDHHAIAIIYDTWPVIDYFDFVPAWTADQLKRLLDAIKVPVIVRFTDDSMKPASWVLIQNNFWASPSAAAHIWGPGGQPAFLSMTPPQPRLPTTTPVVTSTRKKPASSAGAARALFGHVKRNPQ